MRNAILDFDGYICKAYYAAKARGEYEFEEMDKVLEELVQAAYNKAFKFFGQEVRVLKVISGHTIKKDIYPSYKLTRKRDEYLGLYREHCKHTNNLIKVPELEADDVCLSIDEYLNGEPTENILSSVLFSDDKDLKNYVKGYYCKINVNEEIERPLLYYEAPYAQMIAGDSEDNVKGVPNVGMKKAYKYLDETNYDMECVVLKYIDANIDIDECLKNIALVKPIIIKDNTYIQKLIRGEKISLDKRAVSNTINEFFLDLSTQVKEIYEQYN